MEKLTESGIITPFIGKTICKDTFARCARKDREMEQGTRFVVYSCIFLDDPQLVEMFGITRKQIDLWHRRGIELDVFLYLNGGVISHVDIYKHREYEDGDTDIVSCTQQDLRIVSRILNFITV